MQMKSSGDQRRGIIDHDGAGDDGGDGVCGFLLLLLLSGQESGES